MVPSVARSYKLVPTVAKATVPLLQRVKDVNELKILDFRFIVY